MSKRKISDSFGDAFRGVGYVVKTERNFRIQIFASFLVMVLAVFFDLRKYEFIVLGLLITLVLILELLNSAIEKFLDVVSPRLSENVRLVKDIMAGAVVLASVCSVIIGAAIFLPYLFEFFGKKW